MRAAERDAYLATQSCWGEVEIDRATGLLLEAALDQARAEALALARLDRRAAALDPVEAHLAAVDAAINAPADLDPASGFRQRAVFRRVGQHLVEDHAGDERGLRRQHDGLAVETHPRGTVAVAVGSGFVGENLVQLGALPLAFGQEIVGLGDGEQARLEGLAELLDRAGAARRLRRDRLHRRQRVLDPMIELVEEKLAALLGGLALGDVLRDADESQRTIVPIDRPSADLHAVQAAVRPDHPILAVEARALGDRAAQPCRLTLALVGVQRGDEICVRKGLVGRPAEIRLEGLRRGELAGVDGVFPGAEIACLHGDAKPRLAFRERGRGALLLDEVIADLKLATARPPRRLHRADERQAVQRALEEHHVAEHLAQMQVRQALAQRVRLAGQDDEGRVGPGRALVEMPLEAGEILPRERLLLDERGPDAIADRCRKGFVVRADPAIDLGSLQEPAGALRVAAGRGQDDDRTGVSLAPHVWGSAAWPRMRPPAPPT